jgi:large subunit ribosomal protein L43
MCSKGVWQLQTLSLRYCAHSGSSRGLRYLFVMLCYVRIKPTYLTGFCVCREVLQSQELIDFAVNNPQLQIDSQIRAGRHPTLVAEYGKSMCTFIDD